MIFNVKAFGIIFRSVWGYKYSLDSILYRFEPKFSIFLFNNF